MGGGGGGGRFCPPSDCLLYKFRKGCVRTTILVTFPEIKGDFDFNPMWGRGGAFWPGPLDYWP